MPDEKNQPKPQINSISDMVSASRNRSSALKKGKSSGITGDFGSASLLLGHLDSPLPEVQRLQFGQSLWKRNISSTQFQQTLVSAATICRQAGKNNSQPDAIDSPNIVGSCLFEGKKYDLQESEPAPPPIATLLPPHPHKTMATEASIELSNLFSAAQNQEPKPPAAQTPNDPA